MKREWVRSTKKLKNLKDMEFLFREEKIIDESAKHFLVRVFRDHFHHSIKQITLVRETSVYKWSESQPIRLHVNWLCPTFGSGNAGLNYWFNCCKNRFQHKDKQ